MHAPGESMQTLFMFQDAGVVYEAEIAARQHLAGADLDDDDGEYQQDMIHLAQSAIAGCYKELGRLGGSLELHRSVYAANAAKSQELRNDDTRKSTIQAARHLARALIDQSKFSEAKKLLIPQMRDAKRMCGPDDYLALDLRYQYARLLYQDDGTMTMKRKAIKTLEDVCQKMERGSIDTEDSSI